MVAQKEDKSKVRVKVNKTQKILTPTVNKLKRPFLPAFVRSKRFLGRRPHRSFRLTKRRDYKRSLKLPGYWVFTIFVWRTLWKHWRLFGGLALTYIVITIIVSGFGQQTSYANLVQSLQSSSGDLFKGNFGAIGKAGLLLTTSVSSGLAPNVTQAQSVIAGLAVLFGWLASVWLLRNVLAGHKPHLRDGLYNSGSPVLATTAVSFVVLLQLIPAALAVIIYTAAQTSGMLDGGVSAMLVWAGVLLLTLISVYWITSSLIALVIVTLPGMYPMNAIRAAGDLVVGRRLRVLFRLIWMLAAVVVVWAVIMIPVIIFDNWINNLVPAVNWFPLVPLLIIALSSVTLIYTSSYIYLLYRRIVDDDARPA